tara:strand:+ start:2516 stop:3532 length:1017 start_codon:yes stop_codon:yes gene_type:complete
MAGKKRGLGRGLDALLGGSKPPAGEQPESGESTADGHAGAETAGAVEGAGDAGGGLGDRTDGEPRAAGATGLAEIPIEFIRPGPFQPRKDMDPDALAELAASIRAQGIMQPIVVRVAEQADPGAAPGSGDRYEIIAGERRWRAAQQAGLHAVPAVIREVTDEAGFALSLIENIQREDLNPIEEAGALQRLVEEFQMTHQEVAEAVGKSRTAVTNYLRLAQLTPDVARMVAAGDLEMGHARALLPLSAADQVEAARQVANQGLNVRQTEALVRRLSKPAPATPARTTDADTRRLEQNLSERLGQSVSIAHTKKGKGRLTINYSSLDELEGILAHFGELD